MDLDNTMDLDNMPQSTSTQRAVPQSAPPSVPRSHIRGNSVHPSSTPSASSHSTAKQNRGHARPSTPPEPPLPPQPSSDDDDDDDDNDISISTVSSRHTSRLPSIPPSSVRQHVHLRAIQKAVDVEKERFKQSDHRNAHLSQVRRIFSDVFQAAEDEDFCSTHVAAPRETVEQYLNGDGPGPDTDELHFTDKEPYNNAWNRAICAHLAHVLWNRQNTEQWTTKKGRAVATVSEAYWEDAVLQKFKRLHSGWIKAQCKFVRDPASGRIRMESREEADMRRIDEGEEIRTIARRRERRVKVRCGAVCSALSLLNKNPTAMGAAYGYLHHQGTTRYHGI